MGTSPRQRGESPRQLKNRQEAVALTDVLKVTWCDVLKDGVTNDKPWAIYEVEAERESGEPVNETLRSWHRLPVGELLEYKVELVPNARYGPAYWLSGHKAPSLSMSKLAGLVRDQGEELAALKRKLERIEKLVELL